MKLLNPSVLKTTVTWILVLLAVLHPPPGSDAASTSKCHFCTRPEDHNCDAGGPSVPTLECNRTVIAGEAVCGVLTSVDKDGKIWGKWRGCTSSLMIKCLEEATGLTGTCLGPWDAKTDKKVRENCGGDKRLPEDMIALEEKDMVKLTFCSCSGDLCNEKDIQGDTKGTGGANRREGASVGVMAVIGVIWSWIAS